MEDLSLMSKCGVECRSWLFGGVLVVVVAMFVVAGGVFDMLVVSSSSSSEGFRRGSIRLQW